MFDVKLPYSILRSLPDIKQHDQLPAGTIKLGECLDNTSGRDKLFTLTNHNGYLSILSSYHAGPKDQYYCDQYDFPLQALIWFPKALDEFRKPPSEGGLHAGAMVSKDVDGEMLAVGSTTNGYCFINRSRNDHSNDGLATIAVGLGSCFEDIVDDLPKVLFDTLDEPDFGISHLNQLESNIRIRFNISQNHN